MACSILQAVSYAPNANHNTTSGTVTVAATQVGSLSLFVYVAPAGGITSFADNASGGTNTWARIQESGSSEPQILDVWATTAASPKSFTSFDCGFSGTVTDIGYYFEIAGANMSGTQIRASNTKEGTGTSAATNAVTPNNGDMVIGIVYWRTTDSTTTLDNTQAFTSTSSLTHQYSIDSTAGTTNVKLSIGILAFSPNTSQTYTTTLVHAPVTDYEGIIIAPAAALAATSLAWVQQPTGVLTNATMSPSPTVQVQDQTGASFSDSGATVTLAASLGTISGGSSTTTGGTGLATFSALTQSLPETGVTLTASSTGLTSTVASSSFTVTGPPNPNRLVSVPVAIKRASYY